MNYLTEEEHEDLNISLNRIFSEYKEKKEKTLGYFNYLRDYELTKIDKRSIHGGELESISPAVFSSVI